MNSTLAFNVKHEIHSRNNLPATNIDDIIYSGASAHMTPFKQDCKDIENTYRKIFLADESLVYCQQMGKIDIPIKRGRQVIGTLRLDSQYKIKYKKEDNTIK